MIISKRQNNKAFTLIETLVAITILMIAIAGPLTVASKGFTSALDAKNQSVAINLAQEGLEYLNNVKDNKAWGDWVPGTEFETAVRSEFSDCRVNNHCSFDDYLPLTQEYSSFTRDFYFSIQSNNQDEVLAVVNVTWNTGTQNGSIELVQTLTHYER